MILFSKLGWLLTEASASNASVFSGRTNCLFRDDCIRRWYDSPSVCSVTFSATAADYYE